MSEYENTMSVNDLDTATPLDGASAAECYAAIRQLKSVMKNVILTSLTPAGSLRTDSNGIVSSGSIVSGSVTSSKIVDGAVTKSKLANNSVGLAALCVDAVVTNKIADNAVTAGKLSANSVTTDKIADSAIRANQLYSSMTDADRPVITNTIRDGAVTDDKITSVGPDKISGGLANQFLFHDGNNWVPTTVTGGLSYNTDTNQFEVSSGISVATVVDTKASGVEGGGPSSPAVWSERDLGQEADPDSIMTFVGNAFQLVEGDYMINVEVSAFNAGTHQVRLRKTLDSDASVTTELLSTSSGGSESSVAVLSGVFSVTDASDFFKIEHWTQTANASNGFGKASNSGENEVYLKGWLVKV